MDLTKIAAVSAYVAAALIGIVGLLTGKGLLPTIFSTYLLFFLVKAVILTPSYFMQGLRGTPDPSVNHTVAPDVNVGKRDDQ